MRVVALRREGASPVLPGHLDPEALQVLGEGLTADGEADQRVAFLPGLGEREHVERPGEALSPHLQVVSLKLALGDDPFPRFAIEADHWLLLSSGRRDPLCNGDAKA